MKSENELWQTEEKGIFEDTFTEGRKIVNKTELS